jgi:hypothetical protein
VLDDTLEQLMKDIWCDGNKNISEWEVFPEWMKDQLDTGIMTHGVESVYIPVCQ